MGLVTWHYTSLQQQSCNTHQCFSTSFHRYQREQRSQCGNWNITQRVTLLFRTSAIIAAGTVSFFLPIHFQWQVSIWRGAIQCLPTELWYSSASGSGDRRDYSYPHTGHRDYLRPQSIHQFPSGLNPPSHLFKHIYLFHLSWWPLPSFYFI